MISIILYQLYAMNGSYIENERVYIYICSKNVGLGGGALRYPSTFHKKTSG